MWTSVASASHALATNPFWGAVAAILAQVVVGLLCGANSQRAIAGAGSLATQYAALDRYLVSKRTGEVLSHRTVYAVTSLAPDQARPDELLELWQAHWRIESVAREYYASHANVLFRRLQLRVFDC